jgi:hypothetical protein
MRLLRLIGLLGLVAVVGCGIFDPKDKEHGGGGNVIIFPPLSSPALAVLNVKLAWEGRDSVRMAQIYRDDYQGTSQDLADPNSGTLVIAKSEEVSAVGGLKRDPKVSFVSVNFQDTTTWIQDPPYPLDPPDVINVIVRTPVLLISYNDPNLNSLGVNDSKQFTFKVRPTSDGSGGIIWQIYRWIEIHDPPPASP